MMMPQIDRTDSEAKENIKKFVTSIISNTFFAIAVISVFFALVLSQKAIALGIIAGGVLSIINFFFMSRNASNLINIASNENEGKRNTVGGFFLRYIFLILALFSLFSLTEVNVIATLIALFSVQIIIYITQLWEVKNIEG
jgi:hypothetical protein